MVMLVLPETLPSLEDSRLRVSRYLPLAILSALGLLSGCASQPLTSAPAHRRIALLELPATVSDRSLRRVLHTKGQKVTEASLASDRMRINESLEAALEQSLSSDVSSPLEIALPDAPGVEAIGDPLDSAALAKLQSLHPADAYVRVRVTDYGETPRSWRGAYIAFEVVTTLAITAALYVHRVTRPIAVVYLAQESVEEVSEGFAGFWALNRLSRPVRIEADMVDGQSGQIRWSESHTGLAPWRWQHLWHMDDATRDELLDTSMRKAVRALADKLEERTSQVPDEATDLSYAGSK
jgi:hypothetical protein